jgi:hypothetical protein
MPGRVIVNKAELLELLRNGEHLGVEKDYDAKARQPEPWSVVVVVM